MKKGNKSMKRYQVITYDPHCGADEKLSYTTKKEAEKVARDYRQIENYDGALVYDLRDKKVLSIHGYIPYAAIPEEYKEGV
ncbi:MAG: hypothetical protein AB7D36_09005 [Oscillospiraceae bacterium]